MSNSIIENNKGKDYEGEKYKIEWIVPIKDKNLSSHISSKIYKTLDNGIEPFKVIINTLSNDKYDVSIYVSVYDDFGENISYNF